MKKIVYSLALFLLFLSGCGTITPTSQDITDSSPYNGDYPLPAGSNDSLSSGYPEPTNNERQVTIPNPTQDLQLGQVKGKFLIDGKPSSGFVLYLAPVVSDAEGTEIVVNFERTKSYSTAPDEHGTFTFGNIPSGRYGLVFDQISASYLMTWPGKEDSLIISVENGKTLDLGPLDYEAPPSH